MTEPVPPGKTVERPSRAPIYWIVGALVFIAVAVSVLVALRSNGDSASRIAPASDTFALRGTLELYGPLFIKGGEDTARPGAYCSGREGYDDIGIGTSVTVTSDGRIIAIGTLQSGVIKSAFAGGFNQATGRCLFEFEVADVPTGHEFYSVEVSHRGQVNYPASDVQNEKISMSLG